MYLETVVCIEILPPRGIEKGWFAIN